MSGLLAAVFFGWPAILAALMAAGVGLIARRWGWLLAGGVLMLPPAWLFSGYPAIRGVAFLLPLLVFAAALALWKRKFSLAWLLYFPVMVASAWLAVLVLLQED